MAGTAPSARLASLAAPGDGPAWRGNWRQWRATPLRAQVYVAGVVVTAVAVTGWSLPRVVTNGRTVAIFALLCAGSVINIELGRWLEGGRLERDRTHKGLSAWPFTAALLLPIGVSAVVALIGYAQMRVRGIRIVLWKWTLSWAAVTLASTAAAATIRTFGGGPLPPTGSGPALLATALAVVAFLTVETLVFLVISRLNAAHDEVHLHRALANPDFYVTELVVLASAATAAVLLRYSPWALLLTLPGWVQMQRAVIYRALREEARSDRKTGLLNSETWRTEAATTWAQARRRRLGLAVLLADLDHFKNINDTYGHLVGDEVVAGTAAALVDLVRKDDLVGRFGGDEFCVLLHDVDRAEVAAAAERIRQRIERLPSSCPELRVTVSVGFAIEDRTSSGRTLADLLAIADKALYQAKNGGRNRVCG